MGTETQSSRQRAVFQMSHHVKLNNPLMGTETPNWLYDIIEKHYLMLN